VTADAGAILVINAGSSSVKFSLFQDGSDLKLLSDGKVEGIGGVPSFTATNRKDRDDKKSLPAASTHEAALKFILDWMGKQPVAAVAHRIVHGGAVFAAPVKITSDVMGRLEKLIPLAPLHQPHNLAAVRIMDKIRPGVPQVACFDTAFHAHHDALFARYALPDSLFKKGIRHYGFHGLSYEWIAHVLRRDEPKLAKSRVIVAHLGNGASLCAMKDGKSVDTTMGMTALDGLPMGTRCGALDPGAIIYMIRDLGMSAEGAEHILYNESGLKGLSGATNDVRALLESGDEKAKFALDYFSLRAAQFMGMMAVALGGVDGIVFTGGIGENAGPVRDNIIKRLEFLKPFEIRVIPANEEQMMAMHARALLA
jgi:acetate kinase